MHCEPRDAPPTDYLLRLRTEVEEALNILRLVYAEDPSEEVLSAIEDLFDTYGEDY
jgi:hypothetical protein